MASWKKRVEIQTTAVAQLHGVSRHTLAVPQRGSTYEISSPFRLLLIPPQMSSENIWTASSDGDAARVQRLVADGVSVNAKDDAGYTPMCVVTCPYIRQRDVWLGFDELFVRGSVESGVFRTTAYQRSGRHASCLFWKGMPSTLYGPSPRINHAVISRPCGLGSLTSDHTYTLRAII